jgi:hypothetical protein
MGFGVPSARHSSQSSLNSARWTYHAYGSPTADVKQMIDAAADAERVAPTFVYGAGISRKYAA